VRQASRGPAGPAEAETFALLKDLLDRGSWCFSWRCPFSSRPTGLPAFRPRPAQSQGRRAGASQSSGDGAGCCARGTGRGRLPGLHAAEKMASEQASAQQAPQPSQPALALFDPPHPRGNRELEPLQLLAGPIKPAHKKKTEMPSLFLLLSNIFGQHHSTSLALCPLFYPASLANIICRFVRGSGIRNWRLSLNTAYEFQ